MIKLLMKNLYRGLIGFGTSDINFGFYGETFLIMNFYVISVNE